MKSKYFNLLPFIILILVTLSYLYYTSNIVSFLSFTHYVSYILICVNIFLYFRNFETGINLTGIILLLGAFNFILILPDETYSISFYVKLLDVKYQIKSPKFSWQILLTFILFLFLNKNMFKQFILGIVLRIMEFIKQQLQR